MPEKTKKTKLEIVKGTTKLVVGFSVSYVVGSVIRNNTSPQTTLRKGEVWVGALALGMLVADHAQDHAEKSIDDIVIAWREFQQKQKEKEFNKPLA